MKSRITRYGEGKTAGGQLVQFRTAEEGVDDAKAALGHFESVSLPVSHKTNVEHGSYGRYSRFDIEKIEYWGGEGGYYEVLEIHDAPEGHHPIVSHSYSTGYGSNMSKSYFVEWESIDAAKASIRAIGTPIDSAVFRDPENPIAGVIRAVDINMLSPWFYAAGDAEIVGDYVFPEDLANDPVYKFGRQFLVPVQHQWLNEIDTVALKTCMGAITQEVDPIEEHKRAGTLHYRDSLEDTNPYFVKTIQWADGSISRISDKTPYSATPRAVDDEPWITEAITKIQSMLSGNALNFTVDFADGGKFVGKFVEPNETKSDPEGDYVLSVTFSDGTIERGQVQGFKPRPGSSTIAQRTVQVYAKRGREVVSVQVDNRHTKPKGKKWAGIFYNRKSPDDAAGAIS